MHGRLDPKAHRVQKCFEVRAVHLETGVKADADLVNAVAATVRAFTVWHGTPTVEVQPVGDAKFAKALAKKLE